MKEFSKRYFKHETPKLANLEGSTKIRILKNIHGPLTKLL
jgi:hypothetical protein